jgi:hypothetical protein
MVESLQSARVNLTIGRTIKNLVIDARGSLKFRCREIRVAFRHLKIESLYIESLYIGEAAGFGGNSETREMSRNVP